MRLNLRFINLFKILNTKLETFFLIFYLVFYTFSFAQEVPFSVDYQNTFRGDIVYLSNNVLSQHPTNNYNTANTINSNIVSVHVDIDNDGTTFNSSSADLAVPDCSTIQYAKLYWAASYPWETGAASGGAADPTRVNPNTVKFKLPGQANYQTLTGTKIYDDNDAGNQSYGNRPYVYQTDITALLQGLTDPNGTYTVANVRAADQYIEATDGNWGCAGGWTLVIAYSNDSMPMKNITFFHGFAGVFSSGAVTNVQFTFNGFQTVPNGQVNAYFGIVTLEGDDNANGNDHLAILDTNSNFVLLSDAVNAQDDFFNSSISRGGANILTRNPASTNTLGYDSDILTIDSTNNPNNTLIGNNQTSTAKAL